MNIEPKARLNKNESEIQQDTDREGRRYFTPGGRGMVVMFVSHHLKGTQIKNSLVNNGLVGKNFEFFTSAVTWRSNHIGIDDAH